MATVVAGMIAAVSGGMSIFSQLRQRRNVEQVNWFHHRPKDFVDNGGGRRGTGRVFRA